MKEDISKTNNEEETTSIEPIMEDELTPEELEDIFDLDAVEAELAHSTWKEEAEQIPLEALNSNEQLVLLKCINEEKLTDTETETLQRVLAQYRPAIQKINPKEKLENLEKNQEHIRAEQDFLQLLQQQNKEKTLTVNYPLDDGSTYQLHLTIKKADAQTIENIQQQLRLFEDLTEKEEQTRIKTQLGQKLTREEEIVYEHLQKRINDKVNANQDEISLTFLSQYTRIQDQDCDDEYMRQVYESMDPIIRLQIFDKVAQLSGMIAPQVDDLFQ